MDKFNLRKYLDVSELIDLKNKNLSFYGCYVLDIKPNEIIKISKES